MQHLTKRFVLIIALLMMSASCTKIVPYYKPDIQQGNKITQTKVDLLKKNMTQAEVIAILGNPAIQQTFNNDKLIYINTSLIKGKDYTEKRLILFFKNDHLVSGQGDFTLPF